MQILHTCYNEIISIHRRIIMTLNNIAVLIDADNASAKTIGLVFQEIEKFGKIRCKKIYGDWGQTNLSSWQEAILRYAIDPMQQFSYVKGKNATDIALVIEAMDLLHSGDFDGFCLVSSDSDFASLAVRIRKNNIPVYGFGKSTAVSSFKQACDKFIEIDNLLKMDNKDDTEPSDEKWDSKKLKTDTKLVTALQESVYQNLINHEDWANYSQVVSFFKKNYPKIQLEMYGYTKLIQILQEIGLFGIKQDKEKLLIRLKQPYQSTVNNRYTTQQLQAEKALIAAITELIKNDPKPDNGWTNISYIVSQLNQNANINIQKYGYAKFSDLMTNIRLFDIKKQKNGVFVKLKNSQNRNTKIEQPIATAKTATLASQTQTPVIINHQVKIAIKTPEKIDVVLWRLTANNQVRGDEDMIFYGQTYSPDESIYLENSQNNDFLYAEFDCQLTNQPSDISRIIFTLSHENAVLPLNLPIQMTISQNMERLFDETIALKDKTAQSMFLFELLKIDTGWKFVERQQLVNADLRQLCEKLGVEVSDD